jgi:D-alanine-D-alanine ligase
MKPRIMLLHNEPVLPQGHPDAESERDVLDTAAAVESILRAGGLDVLRFGVGADLRPFLALLNDDPPDAVFNLFEGFANRPITETTIAGILEWIQIPFTGNSTDTLTLARDKMRTKHLFRGAGLPTAPFYSVDGKNAQEHTLGWPVIVKPIGQDASVGIDQHSVVSNQKSLTERVAWVCERYRGPALVEQFIPGREFLIHVFEGLPNESGIRVPTVIPASEIQFLDKELWPIYSYDAKWTENTREFDKTAEVPAVPMPEAFRAQLDDLAIRAYRLLGCRDYARVDVRVTPEGAPYLLELNPNPYLLGIGLMGGLTAMGKTHTEFVLELAMAALGRG